MNVETAQRVQRELTAAGFRVEVVTTPVSRPIARPEKEPPPDVHASVRVWMGGAGVALLQRITEYIAGSNGLDFYLPSTVDTPWWLIVERD